jgi:DNA-binding MarR family transcriptional regulator
MKSKTGKARRVSPEERVGQRLSVIAKRLDQALAAMHVKLGISVNNWKIMSVIASFGPLSATVLGARTSLDPDKVTRAVDTLVDRGYVIRKHDEADRRRVVLTLSAKGRRAHVRIEAVASTMEAEFLSVLTGEEYRSLLSALSTLEQHSSIMFSRREGWFERRHLAGATSRAGKARARSGKRGGKETSRKLASAR